MNIADYCNRDVVIVDPAASVLDAARLMRDQHVGCVIACAGGGRDAAPVGVLTDRDVVVAVVALNLEAEEVTVGDVMSAPPHTVTSDANLTEALEIMRAKGVRRLPVVDTEGRVAGIVAADDLLALLADEMSSLAHLISREQRRERERRRVPT